MHDYAALCRLYFNNNGVARLNSTWPTLLTALLEYLTVLLEYLDLFILTGRAQQTFGRPWALPGLPLATPLLNKLSWIQSLSQQMSLSEQYRLGR